MRQIQADNSLITGGHNVIFKIGMMLLMVLSVLRVLATDLLHPLLLLLLVLLVLLVLSAPLGLRPRVPDRLVELAESVLCFDDVEILSVCLSQRERFRKTLVVQSNLPYILLSRLKLNNNNNDISFSSFAY